MTAAKRLSGWGCPLWRSSHLRHCAIFHWMALTRSGSSTSSFPVGWEEILCSTSLPYGMVGWSRGGREGWRGEGGANDLCVMNLLHWFSLQLRGRLGGRKRERESNCACECIYTCMGERERKCVCEEDHNLLTKQPTGWQSTHQQPTGWQSTHQQSTGWQSTH